MMTHTKAMTHSKPKEEKGSSREYFSDLFRRATRHKKKMTLQTVELKVIRMDSEGCELKVRKALQRMPGVQTVDVNRKLQKVTVTGYIEPSKVLRKVQATGKNAEIWPYVPYSSVTQHVVNAQTYDKKAPLGFMRKESFDTGINPNRPDEVYGSMFSEENANACTLM
ncbi:hypothetical protein SUGI_1089030 [Cryptomeria japonica]|uniref:heavy metal-associated isoprenylated plant protein 20 isoform X2 n=1 Tax=Cryptomeria japonica TaxID=3369 RepID=UPI0024148984|nr:heavy metal-associated isoprenylated plant protein 20 isoform X2 [Cryptomeria japonica]GLJ51169.1 hypothetical protein SUGI_1089030 [Cryptomeria japonica]